MSLKVTTRFPGGNAADIEIVAGGPVPEVRFASDPCGGPEAMWFHFRLEETAPDPATQTKVRLTWTYFDNVLGATESPDCIPVCLVPGQAWARLKRGEETRTPDGRRQLSWTIPHPAPTMEFAFCFPYVPADVDAALDRSKDYWQAAPIGLSQGGRRILRLHNVPGTPGGTQPGIYIVTRQHAGETPGSWVLDGFLRHWAQIRKGAYVIWAVPLADIDGVMGGHYGKDAFPYDLNRAWGVPPMRHETLAIRHDVERWKARCKPMRKGWRLRLRFQGSGRTNGRRGNQVVQRVSERIADGIRRDGVQARHHLSLPLGDAEFRHLHANGIGCSGARS